MTAQILVVDEDATERRHVKAALEQVGYNVVLKASMHEALALLKQHDQQIDAVIFDLAAATPEALDFIKTVGDIGLDVPVIVQAGQGGLSHVVEALRVGAYDFVIKPVSRARLNAVVDNALTVMRVGKNRPQLKSRSGTVNISSIISASQAMTRVIALARKATHSTIPIILEGESGVGKEMIARAIHSAGDRSTKPFVVVNCGMTPRDELDALLFGSAKLQAAAAPYLPASKLQEAEGGTLFLEEVGELPLALQAKLLRAVQDGQVEARSGQSAKRINVRIISSTTKDLIAAVRSGHFREDLYYRLNVYPIVVPALRRRKEDISQLVRLFVEQASQELRKVRPLAVSSGTLALLTSYDWPGNVRQLENAVYRAVTLAESHELSDADFPQIVTLASGHLPVRDNQGLPELVSSGQQHLGQSIRRGDELSVQAQGEQSKMTQDEVILGQAGAKGAIASIDEFGDVRTLAEIEEELIRFALGFYRGQMSQVARKLGIGRSTLYRKLKDYGIDPDDPLRDVA